MEIKTTNYLATYGYKFYEETAMDADKRWDDVSQKANEYVINCVDKPFVSLSRHRNTVSLKTSSREALEDILQLL